MIIRQLNVGVTCLALLALALPSVAQEEEGKVIATIESDSEEALELFLDWMSLRSSVKMSFSRMQEIPDGLEEWLSGVRGALRIVDGKVLVPQTEENRAEVENFIDEVFHVFRETVFRQYCVEQLNLKMEKLMLDLSSIRNDPDIEWSDTNALQQQVVSSQERLFEMELETAQHEATLEVLHAQQEAMMEFLTANKEQGPDVESINMEFEIERLGRELAGKKQLFEKDFLTKDELLNTQGELEALERSLKQHIASSAQQRQHAISQQTMHFKQQMLEVEMELTGFLVTRELIQEKAEILKKKLHRARERQHYEAEFSTRAARLEQLINTIRNGEAFPISPLHDVPQIRLRWTN